MAIAEHELKRFFFEPPGEVEVDASPSYADGPTMRELLALDPGAADRLLGLHLGRYTDDVGVGGLAARVAALYRGVEPHDVLVLSGVDDVILAALASLVSPGSRVALMAPAYPPLRNVAAWRGAEVREWWPEADGGWDAARTDGAELIVATLPHSPLAWSPTEPWLAALAARAEARGQTLVVDEIYRGIDLTSDGSGVLPSACELSERAVVFGGLAKTFGLTGLRVGWLVCRHAPTRDAILSFALNGNSNVCSPTELLGGIALDHADALLAANAAVARANLDAVAAFVERSEGLFTWARPTAGLLAWLEWHGPGSAHALATSVLEHEHILVADHTLFGMPDAPSGGGIRLGLGPKDMPARLVRLEAAITRYVRERKCSEAAE
jgi:aspartate/methionine/tyrosine aminotransferase